MSSAAARQRAHRARQREGKIMLMIEANEVDLTEALLAGGFLDPAHAEDRARIEAATERMLAVLVTHNAGPH